MRKIVGVGVSAGIAIGIVKILSANDHAVERRVVDDSQEEVARFRKAQDAARQQLKTLRDKTAAEFGEGKAELFDAHQLMLRDPDYVESIESMISGNKVNAEFAVNSTAEQFAAMFVAMDNSYMQVRAVDIKDVSKRLLNVLEGKTTGEGNDDGVPPYRLRRRSRPERDRPTRQDEGAWIRHGQGIVEFSYRDSGKDHGIAGDHRHRRRSGRRIRR